MNSQDHISDNTVFNSIGKTPIFQLRQLSQELGATIYGKADFLNPGGSIKDRIALAMIEAAERDGRLTPGATITEATAGNTGLGLAWIAAARGYRFVAVMTEVDRGPKTDLMEALGTEVVLVPYGVAWDTPDGPLGIAERIAQERGGVFLNQFFNPANPEAHERTTGAEIREAFRDRPLDAIVVGIGTGGTATGIGRALKGAAVKSNNGKAPRLIGVVGDGSYLTPGETRIAGITPDFPPATYDESFLERVEGVSEAEGAQATLRLARTEGLAVGHSSGAGLVVAEREVRRNPGSHILILLCDTLRNYPNIEEMAG